MKKRIQERKKIFVGLSGGVDSSVTAALLQKEGHDVTGVFIKVWEPDFLPCTSVKDRHDAMRVCAHLRIPFLTLDLKEVYKREVVGNMLSAYKAGFTPNPDVMCNRSVKFGAFLNWARGSGADGIATGHYAQILHTPAPLLFAGVDEGKDQSYFLWKLTENDLPFIYFPVGGLKKKMTRSIAKNYGLKTASKKDSQGLCFLGKLDMKEFLGHFIEKKQGDVVTEKGRKIGKHDGALFYTEGERHGFRLTDAGVHRPYYVVGKDIKNNVLIVSHSPKPLQSQEKGVQLSCTNWIGEPPEKDREYLARTRHRGKFLPVKVVTESKTIANVTFVENTPLVAKGQSLVLYERCGSDSLPKLRVVGGGVVS